MSQPYPPNISPRPLGLLNELEFWWSPPTYDGGSPVTYYKLLCSSISYVKYLSSNATETRVPSLSTSKDYQFSLLAANFYGEGQAADFVPVQPGYRASGALIKDITIVSTGVATISWHYSAKEDEGSSKWFVLIATPTSPNLSTVIITAAADTSSITTNIYSLLQDKYVFNIIGVNDSGWQYSSINSITADLDYVISQYPPTQPINVTLLEYTTQGFTVSWSGAIYAVSYSFTLDGTTVYPYATDYINNTVSFVGLEVDTQYSLVITAINSFGTASSSSSNFRTSALTAPYSVTFSSIEPTAFTVTWLGGTDASSYYYTLNGNKVIPYLDNGVASKSATFTNLLVGTTYIIVIIAKDSGDSLPSEEYTVQTAPSVPINLSASNVTDTGFTVGWTGGTEAISYTYSLNDSIVVPQIDNGLTIKTATFTGLTPNVSYALIVTAVNRAASSSSSSLTVITIPSEAVSLVASSISTNGFIVSWSGGTGSTSYSYTLNGIVTVPSVDNGNSATFVGLNGGTVYPVIVIAINDGGSNSSNPLQVTTTPTNITNLQSSNVDSTSFTITWSGGNGATSYSYTLNDTPTNPTDDQGVTNNTATFSNLLTNITYTVVVTAINSGGSTPSSPLAIVTIPSKPVSLTPSNITLSGFTISWSGATDATAYSYTLNGATITPSTDNGLSAQNAIFTALTANTSYSVIVTATSVGGSTSSSPFVVLTSPTQPDTIIVSAISQTGFRVSWSGGAGATSYTYILNGNVTAASIDNGVSDKNATFTDLTAGVTYPFVIIANNETSSTSSTSIEISTAPGKPSSLISSNITASGFTVGWSGATGASSYTYSLNDVTTIPYVDNGISGETVTFTDLSGGTAYTLIVTATNTGGSTASNPYVVTTTPSQPVSLQSSDVTEFSFNLSWSGGAGATSYLYTLDGNPSIPSTDSGILSKTAIFTGLVAGTNYAVIVTAVNSSGSTSSSVYNVITEPSQPTDITASNITSSGFTITWTGGTGAISYTYTFNGDPKNPTTISGESAIFTDLSGGTSYSVVVIANNPGGSTSSAATTIVTAPVKPYNLTITDVGINHFTVEWSEGHGVTSYIYVINERVVTPTTDNGILYKNATFTDLTGGTTYAITITAVNIGGLTTSDLLTFSTLPTEPISVTVANIIANGFSISWIGGDGATSYTYSLNGTITTPATDDGVSNQIASFTGLTGGTTYAIIVNAINGSGYTSSSAVSALTSPSKPTALAARSITNNGFTISWSGGNSATSYSYSLNGVTVTPLDDSGVSDKYVVFSNLYGGTNYTVIVNATNSSGSISSNGYTIQTAPSLPTNLSSSSITKSGFTLNWTGGVGATSYTYSLNNVTVVPSSDNGVASQTAVFSDLIGGAIYSAIVTAINANGSTSSTSFNILTKPSSPLSLAVSSYIANGFTVSWSGAVGATSYSYTLNGVATTPATDNGLASKSADFTNLNGGTSYTVLVSAINSSGSSSSTELSVLTIPDPATSLVLSNIGQYEFTIRWSGATGATSFQYLIDNSLISANSETSNSATFLSLSAGRAYSVVVRAMNVNGSTNSEPYYVTTIPDSITSLTASNITTSAFTISWQGATGAHSYSYTVDGVSKSPSIDNGVSAKTATFSSVGGTTYVVIVTAIDEGGSISSSPLSILTPPSQPTTLSSLSISQTGFTIGWSGGVGATTYSYSLNNGSTTIIPTTDNGIADKNAIFTGLSAGTIYQVIVTANNASGSTSSTVLTVITSPGTPTSLSSSNISQTGFTISWSGAVGALSYSYTLNGISTTPDLDAGLASQYANFTGLTVDTPYDVIVTAINSGGSSSSLPFNVVTVSGTPTALLASSITQSTFYLLWTGETDAISATYLLNGVSTVPSTNNFSSNYAIFTGLSVGTFYSTIVTITDSSGSIWSDTLGVLTKPDTPISLAVSSVTQTGFTLNWIGGTGATAYTYLLNTSTVIPTTDNGPSSQNAVFTNLVAGTTQAVVVTALNASGSISSLSTTFTLVPSQPSSLSQSAVTASGFTVSWLEGLGASSYSYLLNSISTIPATNNGVSAKNAIFTGLAAGSAYSTVVTAINTYGSASSISVGFITAPSQPILLTASVVSATGFTVSWSGGIGATSYTYSLNAVATLATTDNGFASNNAVFTGLSAGTSYTVIVTAANHGGSSASGSFVIVTLPSPITTVSASSITEATFFLKWSGGSGATSYTYTLNASTIVPSTNNFSSNSAIFTGLSSGTLYSTTITATNTGGSVSSSAIAILTAPATPVALSASSITATGFTVSWSGGTGTTSYVYTLNNVSSIPGTDNGVLSKNAIFSGLTAGTAYSTIVIAVNSGGSTSSAALTIITVPSQPISLASSGISASGFTVSWTGGTGATSYTYTLNGVSTTAATDNGLANKNAIFTGLSESTTYTIIVTAVNTSGSNSSASFNVVTA